MDCMRKPWNTRVNHRVHEETLDTRENHLVNEETIDCTTKLKITKETLALSTLRHHRLQVETIEYTMKPLSTR